MTSELAHPALGTIIGLDNEKTTNYRGLKYASLEHPFAKPILFTNTGDSNVDTTSYSSACPQNPKARDHEFTFIQHTLPCEESHFSSMECLTLNIVTPKNIQHPVPVFVFIHGGGFSIGANSWPQCDPTRLVELSIEKNTPVIGININYRLGALGFLSSQELLSAGIKSNNGLRDQRTALLWIRSYIDGFGGDSNNITVVGVSTGAISCLLHLESPQPLFKRNFAMGGTPLLLKPLPPQVTETTYTAVVNTLGLTAMTPEKRIEALKEATAGDLLAATENLPMLPVIDGDLITVPATFSQWPFKKNLLPGIDWCESIMIGDCEMDSSVLFYMLHDRHEGIDKAFISSTEHSLDDSPTKQQLLEEYNFLSVSANSSNDAVDKVLHFANDIGFLVSIASGWPRTAYVFHFNKPNPWSGEKRQKFVKSKKSADYGRRSTIFKWAETSSLEKLSDAWGVFLRGE